ncbi:MAG: helix-turn-helix domain-containing protein [Balneolaceae bacterium]
MNEFGRVIRFHRKKSGLTQKELADLAGIGKTSVFDIEHDKPTVQLETLQRVCLVLNIEMKMESPLMELYKQEGRNDAR